MKIQITRNDVRSMVNEAVRRIVNEEVMNNAGQRIAVVRNIYNKHHKLDPSFTWDDAIERYKSMHQHDLEGSNDDFNARDIEDSLEDYDAMMQYKQKKKQIDTAWARHDFDETSSSLESKMIMAIEQCHVDYQISDRESFGTGGIDIELGSDECNGRGVNKEFMIPAINKAIEIYRTIIEDCGEALHPYDRKGLNVAIPGPDNGSALFVYGYERIHNVGERITPEQVYEKSQNVMKYDEIITHMITCRAKIHISYYGDRINSIQLYFIPTYDKEGKAACSKLQMAAQKMYDDAAAEHNRFWGPTNEL